MSPTTLVATRATALALPICLALVGCGAGTAQKRQELLPKLQSAMTAPVDTPEQSQEHSRLAEQVADSEMLMDMPRHEVEEALGKGDPCSRHPRCAEKGFEADDWYYQIGRMGESDPGRLPALIVGFDRFGKVTQLYNFRTH
ncbi:MAG: hypothetical protein ACOCUS_02145 [Polyangiales bacterium]